MHQDRDIAYYRKCLGSCPLDHRVRAATCLGKLGPEAVEALATALRDPKVAVRLAAIHSLADLRTTRAVELLCRALNDSHKSVREAAAESLQECDGHLAVQPLIQALRDCFMGHSTRGETMFWVQIIAGVLLVSLGFFTGNTFFSIIGVCNCLAQGVIAYCYTRNARRKKAALVAGALARIAERSPTPELRAALPELRALTGPGSRHRAALSSGEAVRRIEALRRQLWDLPLAAGIPASPPASLPRPADAAAPNPDQLPVVRAQAPDAETATS